MGVAGKREIENDPPTFGLNNWGDGGSTHHAGDHCPGSKTGGRKSRVLFWSWKNSELARHRHGNVRKQGEVFPGG